MDAGEATIATKQPRATTSICSAGSVSPGAPDSCVLVLLPPVRLCAHRVHDCLCTHAAGFGPFLVVLSPESLAPLPVPPSPCRCQRLGSPIIRHILQEGRKVALQTIT